MICSFYLSVAARTNADANPSLKNTLQVAETLSNQERNELINNATELDSFEERLKKTLAELS